MLHQSTMRYIALTEDQVAERQFVIGTILLILDLGSVSAASKKLGIGPSTVRLALQRFFGIIIWRLRKFDHTEALALVDSSNLVRTAKQQANFLRECARRLVVEIEAHSYDVWAAPLRSISIPKMAT